METHLKRHGTFSSSSAWKLMTNDRKGSGLGAPALKYIKQVNYERKLGRAINKEVNAKATTWGTFLESRVHALLPLEYSLVSQERLFHPTIKCWSGMPDLKKVNTVADVKCPYSIETFCDKIESLEDIENYKLEFPEDYWQHVSNAILLTENGFNVDYFEAIIYMPYKSELDEIRESTSMVDGSDQNKLAWINFADDEDLPYLNDGGIYQNINVINFRVPEEDKKALTSRVLDASKLLVKV